MSRQSDGVYVRSPRLHSDPLAPLGVDWVPVPVPLRNISHEQTSRRAPRNDTSPKGRRPLERRVAAALQRADGAFSHYSSRLPRFRNLRLPQPPGRPHRDRRSEKVQGTDLQGVPARCFEKRQPTQPPQLLRETRRNGPHLEEIHRLRPELRLSSRSTLLVHRRPAHGERRASRPLSCHKGPRAPAGGRPQTKLSQCLWYKSQWGAGGVSGAV
mmetsp:Transcript_22616/g.39991  ORF Transcript_22616/g.39991 Transcript_22616/m.39991 type:complete len:213 (-) Transcript_22616:861-1499(-)